MDKERLELLLERHFRIVDTIILSRQDPVTGLLPASTAINAHGDYTDAWVRDNVYSIMSVWGLALAYRRHFPDHHRSYLLAQSVVKLMRGLLGAMMRQSDRVERFKNTLDPIDSLHAKYGTKTGLSVVGDDEWGHLQLDATSLYLLMTAQMTASGLRLIYTMDEVDFVQNLVHYISRAYCTADYGIWERGNKINHGTTEINCSSVGMAKAALEAMDGLNLFGNVTTHEAVIHVIPSDIARARFTLQGLLPRESNSKETDAALLSIVGYPGYAVEDEELLTRTRDKIIKKLAGNYGCKRFLLDGHQSSIEDTSRLHYEASELREFEHIESEWPLFFTYLLLDALIREDAEETGIWMEKLRPLFVEESGQQLLPELYIVPKELIAAEKSDPGSQKRIPNENVPLVWAQSLFILADMMMDGILRPADIDPMNRRGRIGCRRNTSILVSVLAENDTVKEHLNEFGFFSETLEELNPIRVMHASELSDIHTMLGKNEKLSLGGRPLSVARTITTSRLHLVSSQEILFLPYYFDPKGFYFGYDNELLAQHFRSSLKFLTRHWDYPGQPIIPFLVREDMLSNSQTNVIVELLHMIHTGGGIEAEIITGPLRRLLNTADTERIDYLRDFTFTEYIMRSEQYERCMSLGGGRSGEPLYAEELQYLETLDDGKLEEILMNSDSRHWKANALALLWQRCGAYHTVAHTENPVSLTYVAEQIYESAAVCHEWAVVRRIADITGTYDDRIEDALLDIIVRQKRLAVGRAYSDKATFSKPHDSIFIIKTIAEFCGNNAAEKVLTQEVILHLGLMIRSEPELFTNMLTLRTWYLVQLLVGQISREKGLSMGDAYEALLALAPHAIYKRLRTILSAFTVEVKQLIDLEHLQATGIDDTVNSEPISGEFSDVEDWGYWRQHMGSIGHLPSDFYKNTWHMLQQCKGLVIGDKYSIQSRIGSELTLDSTAGEHNFALRIDSLMQGIQAPDYRQLNIEAIESLSRLFRQNPQMYIDSDLVLDVLIGHAVRIAWHQEYPGDHYDEVRARAWETFYKRSPKETDEAFREAFISLLSSPQGIED